MSEKSDISLEIISAEQTLVNCLVNSVELPGTLGRFEVLRDHAPLLSSLAPGDERVAIRGGFVEVADNHVNVCVEV